MSCIFHHICHLQFFFDCNLANANRHIPCLSSSISALILQLIQAQKLCGRLWHPWSPGPDLSGQFSLNELRLQTRLIALPFLLTRTWTTSEWMKSWTEHQNSPNATSDQKDVPEVLLSHSHEASGPCQTQHFCIVSSQLVSGNST